MRQPTNNGHRFTMKMKGLSIEEGGMIGEFVTGPRTFTKLESEYRNEISFDLYTDNEPRAKHSRADIEQALNRFRK